MTNENERKSSNPFGGVVSKTAGPTKWKQFKLRSHQQASKRKCWLHANLELLQIDNIMKECVTQGWLDIAWQDHALAKKMNDHQVQTAMQCIFPCHGDSSSPFIHHHPQCIFPSVSKS